MQSLILIRRRGWSGRIASLPLFRVVVRGFIHALVFYLWGDSLNWLRSYCWETARQSFTPILTEHPALDRKKWHPLMVSTSSITLQSLEKVVLCEPAVGAKQANTTFYQIRCQSFFDPTQFFLQGARKKFGENDRRAVSQQLFRNLWSESREICNTHAG